MTPAERVRAILLRCNRMRLRAGKDPLPEDMLVKSTIELPALRVTKRSTETPK